MLLMNDFGERHCRDFGEQKDAFYKTPIEF